MLSSTYIDFFQVKIFCLKNAFSYCLDFISFSRLHFFLLTAFRTLDCISFSRLHFVLSTSFRTLDFTSILTTALPFSRLHFYSLDFTSILSTSLLNLDFTFIFLVFTPKLSTELTRSNVLFILGRSFLFIKFTKMIPRF